MIVRFLRRVTSRLRASVFPSEHDLILRKWSADGGDEALRFNYPLDADSLVLDLGGYEGQWASDIFGRFCCKVCVFEPVVSFADRIAKRFAANDRIEILRIGLGGNSRSENLYLRGDSSSVFGKSGDVTTIEIVDAKEWFEKRGITEVALLKINIEGGEYELLERLIETRLIETIDHLQVQFHRIATASVERMERIQTELSRTHQPTYQYRFVWESWSRRK